MPTSRRSRKRAREEALSNLRLWQQRSISPSMLSVAMLTTSRCLTARRLEHRWQCFSIKDTTRLWWGNCPRMMSRGPLLLFLEIRPIVVVLVRTVLLLWGAARCADGRFPVWVATRRIPEHLPGGQHRAALSLKAWSVTLLRLLGAALPLASRKSDLLLHPHMPRPGVFEPRMGVWVGPDSPPSSAACASILTRMPPRRLCLMRGMPILPGGITARASLVHARLMPRPLGCSLLVKFETMLFVGSARCAGSGCQLVPRVLYLGMLWRRFLPLIARSSIHPLLIASGRRLL